MANIVSKNKKIVETEEIITTNENSMYDYFKEKPSVFIACASTIIAIVTFFARFTTLIASRKELAYWGFDASYATFGSDSIVYTAIIFIIFSLLMVISLMWLSPVFEAYADCKKFNLSIKYFGKSQSKEISKIKKKIKNNTATDKEREYGAGFDRVVASIKKAKMMSLKTLLVNIMPVLLITFLSSMLLALANANKYNSDFWSIILFSFTMQAITFMILKSTVEKRTINRKSLKQNCADFEYVISQNDVDNFKEYPFDTIVKRGIRKTLKNSTIIFIVIMLILNCIILCFSYAIAPIRADNTDEEFQIVTIDETDYGVLLKNGNRYFLQEAEIKPVKKGKMTLRTNFIIYTDRQRIIETDDISIRVQKFDRIIKAQRG